MNPSLVNEKSIYLIGLFVLTSESIEDFSIKFGVAEVSGDVTLSLVRASVILLCFIAPIYYVNKIKHSLLEHFEDVKRSAEAQAAKPTGKILFIGKKHILNATIMAANILNFLTPALFTIIVAYVYFS